MVERDGSSVNNGWVWCDDWGEAILAPFAGGTQIVILYVKRGVKTCRGLDTILPRPHIQLPDHAHLQVFWRRDMAVPEVSAGIRGEGVVGEAAADVDGDRGVRDAGIDRRSIGIPVEVNRQLPQ